MPSTWGAPFIAGPRKDCSSDFASLAKQVRQKARPGLSCGYKFSMADSWGESNIRTGLRKQCNRRRALLSVGLVFFGAVRIRGMQLHRSKLHQLAASETHQRGCALSICFASIAIRSCSAISVVCPFYLWQSSAADSANLR